MGIFDFILYPFYLILFNYLFSLQRKRYNDPILQYYHKQGFWIKALVVLPFTIFNVYISLGDSFGLYYTEGVNIQQLILKDSSHIKWIFSSGIDFDQDLLRNTLNRGYFRAENNYMIARLVTIFSFVSFGKYLIINLFFGMFAFTGLWRLYRFFYEQYPQLHKQLAIAILYLPTVVFWSSGILKDSICIGSLGWITYSIYEMLYKKKKIVLNLAIIFISGYFLSVVKVYILVSYVPFLFLFIILKNMALIKNRFLKVSIMLVMIVSSLALFTKIIGKLTESLGEYGGDDVGTSMSKKQSAYRESSSSFSLGAEFNGSMGSLLRVAPMAIIATLYRPFIWESRNITTLLSSFESLFVMGFTLLVLYRHGPKHFLQCCIKEPSIMYCILFSLLFALFVGATTANFGSLVRYKIPCMPFYLIALYIIEFKAKTKNSPVVEAV